MVFFPDKQCSSNSVTIVLFVCFQINHPPHIFDISVKTDFLGFSYFSSSATSIEPRLGRPISYKANCTVSFHSPQSHSSSSEKYFVFRCSLAIAGFTSSQGVTDGPVYDITAAGCVFSAIRNFLRGHWTQSAR